VAAAAGQGACWSAQGQTNTRLALLVAL